MRYRDMADRLLCRSALIDGGCWLWLGRVEPNGYAKVGTYVKGKVKNYWVHRVAFEVLGGATIPKGYHIDHVCKQPLCINPDHLECVPAWINAHLRVSKKRGQGGRYE